MPKPIHPTRIIPGPGSPPPPAGPPAPWWHGAPPPPPVVHVDVHLPAPLPPVQPAVVAPDPQPGIRWWQTFRPLYNLACAACAWPLAARWADVLTDARISASMAGAWVIALVPLGVVALVDNVWAVAAANAAPRLWLPRIKAAASRVALWALLTGTAVALPVMTVVYIVTGVRS
jgi:hypothetical protein